VHHIGDEAVARAEAAAATAVGEDHDADRVGHLRQLTRQMQRADMHLASLHGPHGHAQPRIVG